MTLILLQSARLTSDAAVRNDLQHPEIVDAGHRAASVAFNSFLAVGRIAESSIDQSTKTAVAEPDGDGDVLTQIANKVCGIGSDPRNRLPYQESRQIDKVTEFAKNAAVSLIRFALPAVCGELPGIDAHENVFGTRQRRQVSTQGSDHRRKSSVESDLKKCGRRIASLYD